MITDAHTDDVIASFYEAAAGALTWTDVSFRVGSLLQATDVALFMPSADGLIYNSMALPELADIAAVYLRHFSKINPYRTPQLRESGNALMTARLGQELVDDQQLLRTEFYNDFGKLYGYHHQVGAVLSEDNSVTISAHRGAKAEPFVEAERHRLQALLPHVKRAVQLDRRLKRTEQTTFRSGFEPLEGLSTSLMIVDGNLNVIFINSAGLATVREPEFGLTIRRWSPTSSTKGLVARHRHDHEELQRLVASAASGGSGGAMRIRSIGQDTIESATTAILVTPVPASIGSYNPSSPRLRQGWAIVAVRDLSRSAISPSLLAALFDLSEAESAVSIALIGGATAEVVARRRKVSLDTVRSQIRSVLQKANAANLREFEHMAGSLSAMGFAPNP